MIWRWRRHRPDRASAVTPTQEADLAEARAALRQVRSAAQSSRSRWPTVLEIKAKLREIRDENHLAADLHTIFTDRRG